MVNYLYNFIGKGLYKLFIFAYEVASFCLYKDVESYLYIKKHLYKLLLSTKKLEGKDLLRSFIDHPEETTRRRVNRVKTDLGYSAERFSQLKFETYGHDYYLLNECSCVFDVNRFNKYNSRTALERAALAHIIKTYPEKKGMLTLLFVGEYGLLNPIYIIANLIDKGYTKLSLHVADVKFLEFEKGNDGAARARQFIKLLNALGVKVITKKSDKELLALGKGFGFSMFLDKNVPTTMNMNLSFHGDISSIHKGILNQTQIIFGIDFPKNVFDGFIQNNLDSIREKTLIFSIDDDIGKGSTILQKAQDNVLLEKEFSRPKEPSCIMGASEMIMYSWLRAVVSCLLEKTIGERFSYMQMLVFSESATFFFLYKEIGFFAIFSTLFSVVNMFTRYYVPKPGGIIFSTNLAVSIINRLFILAAIFYPFDSIDQRGDMPRVLINVFGTIACSLVGAVLGLITNYLLTKTLNYLKGSSDKDAVAKAIRVLKKRGYIVENPDVISGIIDNRLASNLSAQALGKRIYEISSYKGNRLFSLARDYFDAPGCTGKIQLKLDTTKLKALKVSLEKKFKHNTVGSSAKAKLHSF